MNAVEIEEAVSALAEQAFDAASFPFAFLEAFGNKETTLKCLQTAGKGSTNQSDLLGSVLQRNNIHLATCATGKPGYGEAKGEVHPRHGWRGLPGGEHRGR